MTWTTLAVLAQGAQPDPLSGGAGWVGAGLLGVVLAWLMFKHLPDKDRQAQGKDAQILTIIETHAKQMAAMIAHIEAVKEKKDRQLDAQRQEFTAALGQMMTAFRAEAGAERQACEKHYDTLAQSMSTAFRTLGDQLSKQAEEAAAHSHRNQQWIDMMKKEIEARRADPEGKK